MKLFYFSLIYFVSFCFRFIVALTLFYLKFTNLFYLTYNVISFCFIFHLTSFGYGLLFQLFLHYNLWSAGYDRVYRYLCFFLYEFQHSRHIPKHQDPFVRKKKNITETHLLDRNLSKSILRKS